MQHARNRNQRELDPEWLPEWGDMGYELMYAKVQTSEVETHMGDLFDGRYLMVNEFHLVDLKEVDEETRNGLHVVTETVRNNSTQRTFTNVYIYTKAEYEGPKHCERLAVSYEEFSLPPLSV